MAMVMVSRASRCAVLDEQPGVGASSSPRGCPYAHGWCRRCTARSDRAPGVHACASKVDSMPKSVRLDTDGEAQGRGGLANGYTPGHPPESEHRCARPVTAEQGERPPKASVLGFGRTSQRQPFDSAEKPQSDRRCYVSLSCQPTRLHSSGRFAQIAVSARPIAHSAWPEVIAICSMAVRSLTPPTPAGYDCP
jgi:hypothetical protein